MTPRKQKTESVDEIKRQLAQYEQVFDDITHFTELISQQDREIEAALTKEGEARTKHETARDERKALEESRIGTKHSLFMFLKPGPFEILPLFDRMEPADKKKHGAHSEEWRLEPISALGISLIATNALTAADVMFVGQLQDRVLDYPDGWSEKIDGLSAAVAAAVADQLNEFIRERTSK